jgi:hypothetical protein
MAEQHTGREGPAPECPVSAVRHPAMIDGALATPRHDRRGTSDVSGGWRPVDHLDGVASGTWIIDAGVAAAVEPGRGQPPSTAPPPTAP